MINTVQINNLVDCLNAYKSGQYALSYGPVCYKDIHKRTVKTCSAVIDLALTATKNDDIKQMFQAYKLILSLTKPINPEIFEAHARTYEIAIRLALHNLDKKVI